MKVTGPGGAGTVGQTSGARRAAPGFSPVAGQARDVASLSPAAAAGGVGSLDALMALQGTPDPMERRRRAVKRAGALLDVLDGVKLSLLDGSGSTAALERLRGAVKEQRDATDDAGLESVLDEIETRAAVELAKQEMARLAA